MAQPMTSLSTPEPKLNYRDLMVFFIPLAISSMLMMGSHSIVSSALARTQQAEMALAAYAVASSISMMFESPCYNIRRMVVALLDDKTSYRNMAFVTLGILFVSIAFMLPIAFTSFGKVVFVKMVGIQESMYPEVIKCFRIFLILPVVSALRSFYQGLIIVQKKTYWMTINIVVRLAVMIGVTSFVLNMTALTNGAVGSVVLISGIGTEAILAALTGFCYRNNLPDQPVRTSHSVTSREALVFFLPLLAAAFIQTFVKPGINAGLARVYDPKLALATYQVAYSFAMIFIAMAFSIHQVVLVFVKNRQTYLITRKFIVTLGTIMTVLMFFLSFTSFGEVALIEVIGVTPELAEPSLKAIAVFALAPLLMSLTEWFTGLLLLKKRTPAITVAKIGNVGAVMIASVYLSKTLPQFGGVIAPICMMAGYIVELLVVFSRSRDINFQ